MTTSAATITRYRRMPMLGDWSLGASSDKARQIHCDRNGGHVLVMKEGEIVCTACDAVWKDEGF